MAYCERCGKTGFTPGEMAVNTQEKIFVGPCCMKDVDVPALSAVGPQPPTNVIALPANLDDVDYGIEVSNKVGVRAYVQYSGFQLSFEKSPKEIRKWAQEQGLIESA